MRIALFTLVVVAALLVLADFGLRHYEESRVASSIKTSLHLPAKPDVSLHGFSFISELAHGRITSASIAAASVRAGSVMFSDVHLMLHHLRFSIDQLLNGNLAAVHAAAGSGDASITAGTVNAFLHAHGAPFQVAFQGGRTIARLGPLAASIDATMKIANGSLVLATGSSSLPQFSVPLPTIFHSLSYGAVRPGNGSLILNFRVLHPTLALQP
ncbi:MAG: LmeA-like phospholipid-binding [Actinomycetota bacterium]|jgi:hypothetical protein|nr:LmeA-like phospholipid-binding [Actinomycetota bacterium]